jgi:hypothetical protein
MARRTTIAVALATVLSGGWAVLEACSSDGAAGPGSVEVDGAAGPSGGDGAAFGEAGGEASSDAGGDAGYNVASVTTLELGNQILAMASNEVTNLLYVSMQALPDGGPQAPGGIAVIDETTHTIKTTIPAPIAGGKPQAVAHLAVDPVANKIYASPLFASGAGYPIWVIDGATNTISPNTLSAPSLPITLAVDPGLRLYAWTFSFGATPQGVSVFDVTAAGSGSPTARQPLMLAEGAGSLAVDTANHRLFACGTVPYAVDPSQSAAIDMLDPLDSGVLDHRTFPSSTNGYFVDCVGGDGFANLLTNGTTSSAPVLHELEPADLAVGAVGFIPDAYSSENLSPLNASTGGHGHLVTVVGHDSATGTPKVLFLAVANEQLFYTGHVQDLGINSSARAILAKVHTINQSAGWDVYVSTVQANDAGIDTPSGGLVILHVQ